MLWSTLQIVLLVYLGVVALIYFRQSALVFLPEMDRGHRASPADIGLPFVALTLATSDGEALDGWHVQAKPGRDARGLVLFFHGNAGNIGHRLDYLGMFHALGFATLIIDYRGYGKSSGSPSEPGTYLSDRPGGGDRVSPQSRYGPQNWALRRTPNARKKGHTPTLPGTKLQFSPEFSIT